MITRWMTRSMILAAVAGGLLADTPAGSNVEITKLQAMAEQAKTPAQHAAVAKQYRLRAESFEAKAVEHEINAERYAKAAGAMYRKWPGMAPRAMQEEKQKAVEARRAAQENRTLAESHLRQSVEAMASAGE